MRFTCLLPATLLLLSISACKQGTPPERTHDIAVRAIQDVESQWNQDFASKDVSKLLAHYAENAVLMTPGEPAQEGLTAIRKSLEHMVADPAFSLKLDARRVEVATSGDLGFTQGYYTLTTTDPLTKRPLHDNGSYVTTYRKQSDGVWKAVADIATSAGSSGPAAPQPVSANK